jgi:hypothetical protein
VVITIFAPFFTNLGLVLGVGKYGNITSPHPLIVMERYYLFHLKNQHH